VHYAEKPHQIIIIMKTTISILVLFFFSFVKTYSQDSLTTGITFTTQEELDNFKLNYPNCTHIGGNVNINYGANITNLNGLDSVTTINGSLLIVDNNLLATLTGLESLTTINGGLGIVSNDLLTDMTGLRNVNSISGNLTIGWNHKLRSLSGLENINAVSIQNLYVYYNDSLRTCEIESVCTYLKNIIGVAAIDNNSIGCNSINEVNHACETIGVSDRKYSNEITLFPNPAQNLFFVLSPENWNISETKIYDNVGKLVKSINGQTKQIDISTLQKGIYIVELFSDKVRIRKKLIIN